MANAFCRSDVYIILGGQRYALRPSFEALDELEQLSGLNAYEIMGKMVEGRGFSARSVAAAIYAGMKAGWPPVSAQRQPTLHEIGALIQAEGLASVSKVFGEFLTKALSSDADLKRQQEEEAKATAGKE